MKRVIYVVLLAFVMTVGGAACQQADEASGGSGGGTTGGTTGGTSAAGGDDTAPAESASDCAGSPAKADCGDKPPPEEAESGKTVAADCPVSIIKPEEVNPIDSDQDGIYDNCEFPQIVSTSESGVVGSGVYPSNVWSNNFDVSVDGRYIAFASEANNLVSGDANGKIDVFVKDRVTGTLTRVSVSSSGLEGDYRSQHPALSQDGRYVVFESFATNLVTNQAKQGGVFVHDRNTGQTTLGSFTLTGEPTIGSNPTISPEGRFIAFQSKGIEIIAASGGIEQVYLYDTETKQTLMASNKDGVPGNASSRFASLSQDALQVAFDTGADNLFSIPNVPYYEDKYQDIAIFEKVTSAIAMLTLGQYEPGTWLRGSTYPLITPDGRYVVFQAADRIYVYDRTTKKKTWITKSLNDWPDIVAVKYPVGSSTNPSVANDGRYIAFKSEDKNFVPGDPYGTSYFIHDQTSGGKMTVSGIPVDGRQKLSGDGRFLVFSSSDGTIVENDTNGAADIFITLNPAYLTP